MLVASFAAVDCRLWVLRSNGGDLLREGDNDTSQPVVVSACATGDGACKGTYSESDWIGADLPTVQGSVGALDVELISPTTGRGSGVSRSTSITNHGVTVHVSEMVLYHKTYPVR